MATEATELVAPSVVVEETRDNLRENYLWSQMPSSRKFYFGAYDPLCLHILIFRLTR